MIIKGRPAGNVGWWAQHLAREDTNDRAEVKEITGLLSEDLPRTLREMQAVASGSRSHGNFMYCANINPEAHEHLTEEQWREAVDTLEKNMGLEGHQRVVVEHEKDGRTHRHIVWNRVDAETLRVVDVGGNYYAHERTARELEQRFDLTPTPAPNREEAREPAPELWEYRAAERSGIDVKAMKAEITALWRSTDSGQAFAAALDEHGYILAKGDRRDFCIVDQAGDAHSLARRIEGARAQDVRARMADIDRDSLPSVAEAREEQHSLSRDGWTIRTPQPKPEARPIDEATPTATAADKQANEERGAELWNSIRAKPETSQEAKQEAWRMNRDAGRARADRGPGNARTGFSPATGGLEVLDKATGAVESLGMFVLNFLSGSRGAPRPEPPRSRFEQQQAERRAEAALERMAESIERGERLSSSDVHSLTPNHLENIRAKGDAYLQNLIDDFKRYQERERDGGRERDM